jgi:hypothetical protein
MQLQPILFFDADWLFSASTKRDWSAWTMSWLRWSSKLRQRAPNCCKLRLAAIRRHTGRRKKLVWWKKMRLFGSSKPHYANWACPRD